MQQCLSFSLVVMRDALATTLVRAGASNQLLVKSHSQFGVRAVAVIASIVLLLALANARIGRPQTIHTHPQFSQLPAAAASTYALVDGFDLALLTCAPIINFSVPSFPLPRITRPHYQSRIEDFPCHVRPPPAA